MKTHILVLTSLALCCMQATAEAQIVVVRAIDACGIIE
jgi:hypothetical protein